MHSAIVAARLVSPRHKNAFRSKYFDESSLRSLGFSCFHVQLSIFFALLCLVFHFSMLTFLLLRFSFFSGSTPVDSCLRVQAPRDTYSALSFRVFSFSVPSQKTISSIEIDGNGSTGVELEKKRNSRNAKTETGKMKNWKWESEKRKTGYENVKKENETKRRFFPFFFLSISILRPGNNKPPCFCGVVFVSSFHFISSSVCAVGKWRW